MRISDWSSDVCSSDLAVILHQIRVRLMQDGLFFLFGLDQTKVDVDLQGPCNTRIAPLAAQSQLTVDRALQALCLARLLGVQLDLQHARVRDQPRPNTPEAAQWKVAAVRLRPE